MIIRLSESPIATEVLYTHLCRTLSGAQPDDSAWTPSDWERFTRLAQAENVAPRLYAIWREAGFPAGLPPEQQARFSQAYFQSGGRSALFRTELAKIGALFAQAGIDCLPLKGAALAGTLYPDPATRPMNDLDLLVRPQHLRRALGILRRLGYSLENFTYHAVLWGPVFVELHWSLPYPQAARRQPPEPWFWQKQAVSGTQPPFDALLLHAIVHQQVQNRGQAPLLSRLDLLYLAQALGPDYDWPALQSRAGEFGWEPAYAAALRGVEQRFPGHLPTAALAALPAESVESAPHSTLNPRDRYTASAWRHLDLLTRLQAALGLVFPGRGYMLWRYHPRPAWLWPLWYPLRWGGLVRGLRA